MINRDLGNSLNISPPRQTASERKWNLIGTLCLAIFMTAVLYYVSRVENYSETSTTAPTQHAAVATPSTLPVSPR